MAIVQLADRRLVLGGYALQEFEIGPRTLAGMHEPVKQNSIARAHRRRDGI